MYRDNVMYIYIFNVFIIYWLGYEDIPVCNFTTTLNCARKISGLLSVVLLI